MTLKLNAKAYAAGAAAFIGSLVFILSSQPVDHQGVQYISQLQWGNVILYILASYGITWRVPNAPTAPPAEAPVAEPVKRGDHAA